MIHIEGLLKDDMDGVEIILPENNFSVSLAEKISRAITEEIEGSERRPSTAQDHHDEWYIDVDASMNISKVAMRFYYSDEKCSLEEAETNFVLSCMGCLDIFQVATGYSEYTITGYSVMNFEMVSEDGGRHNLEAIFRSFIGKYVHILIDVIEV